MKINISELFKYRQYIDAPVCYCLDRKDYKVCDISVYQTEPDTPLHCAGFLLKSASLPRRNILSF